jgi:hypothetical protein
MYLYTKIGILLLCIYSLLFLLGDQCERRLMCSSRNFLLKHGVTLLVESLCLTAKEWNDGLDKRSDTYRRELRTLPYILSLPNFAVYLVLLRCAVTYS